MIDTQKLKSFIKSRREQAKGLRQHHSFDKQDKLNCKLREENARAFEWFCDVLEFDFPELKD